MSLPAQNPSQSMVAIAAQTIFPFTFRCDDSTTIQAWANDVQQGGVIVALNADQVGAPGGTVTLAAQAAGVIVTVERVSPQVQALALTAYGPYSAATLTLALDKIVELLQEFWALLSRVFRVTRKNLSSMSTLDWPAPGPIGGLVGWGDGGGGKFKLATYNFTTAGLGAIGEALADSGDHLNFISLHATKGPGCLYRNGQRIFSPDDYTQVVGTNQWTMLVALGAGEKLNADYPF